MISFEHRIGLKDKARVENKIDVKVEAITSISIFKIRGKERPGLSENYNK